MDPIAQIFQQASAPTGKWDLPAQMFIQGRQLGQSQQRLNMQQQEQDIMLPLEAEAKRLAANSTMLDLQIKRNALERDNQIKAGELELSQILLDAGKYPDGLANFELVQRLHRVSVTNPAAMTSHMGQAAMNGTQAAFAANRAMKRFGEPTKVTISPTGAESFTFGEGQETAATRTREQLQRDIDEAEAAGDFRRADALIATRDKDLNQQRFRATTLTQAEQRLKDTKDWRALSASMRNRGLEQREVDLAMRQFKEGMNVEVAPTPDVATQQWLGQPKVKISAVERPPTVGAATKSQEESLSAEASLAALNDAIAATEAHPEAFGVQGYARRKAEQAYGQLHPNEKMETPIADTQQKATIAFSRVAKSLRPDSGNMSHYELSKLEKAGETLKLEVSPQEALTLQRNLRNVVVAQKLRHLHFQHAEVPENILRAVESSEVLKLVEAGLLTDEEARRWKSLK